MLVYISLFTDLTTETKFWLYSGFYEEMLNYWTEIRVFPTERKNKDKKTPILLLHICQLFQLP